jgi:site-specific recombinase XerD
MRNAMKKFIEHLEEQDLSSLTIQGYSSDISHFVQWFAETNGDAQGMESITPLDMKEYKQYLLVAKRRKASTINRQLSAISMWMQWAMEEGLIRIDPMRSIKRVESSTNVIRWLDKKEQFALQRAIEKDLQVSKLRYPKRWLTHRRDASLTLFLLNTGLRLNECTNLTLADVTLSARKGSVLVQNGKGSKQRIVPLNNEARKAVEEWLKVRPEGSEHLWTTVEAVRQTKLTGRTVQRMLARYAQEAGLENLTPHMLRHSFAKNLVMNDVGLEEVAALLGHANLNTTRTYITPSAKDLEASVSKLDEY